MAGGFLRSLLGRGPSVPDDVAAALAELAALAKKRPSLAALAGELGDILPALFSEPLVTASAGETSPELAAKLAGGVPLFRGLTLAINLPAFKRRWQHVCTVLARRRADAGRLADAMARRLLDPAWHLETILAGHVDALHGKAESLGLDVSLTATVWWLTLLPVLAHHRAALPDVPTGSWVHGYCPYCGSWPRLGEFRGLEQTRWLRCGLCAAEWEFPRLCCPFCGNRDHRALGYLHLDEDAHQRAATCDACQHYVKMLATLTALTAPGLLVADLATATLDLAAADHRYLPPG